LRIGLNELEFRRLDAVARLCGYKELCAWARKALFAAADRELVALATEAAAADPGAGPPAGLA